MKDFQTTLEVRAWDGAGIALRNFSPVEDGFVWQTGRWGEITFDFTDPNRGRYAMADLMMDLDAFRHAAALPAQNVFIYLNGLRIGSFLVTGRRILIMSFPCSILRAAENVLTIDTPDAAAPSAFGIDDGRVLGVSIFSISIRKAE